jgi:hypothetical protein
MTLDHAVSIRFASPSDRPALARLAALDSAPEPSGAMLLAEVDGEVVAALEMDTGAHLADPFRPTADVLELLELRSRSLREPRPLLSRLRLGFARAA